MQLAQSRTNSVGRRHRLSPDRVRSIPEVVGPFMVGREISIFKASASTLLTTSPLSARGIRSSHGSRSRRLHLARSSLSSASPTSLNDTRYGGPLLSPSKFSSTRDQIRMERALAFSLRRFSDPLREHFRKWYNAREIFVFESTDKLII